MRTSSLGTYFRKGDRFDVVAISSAARNLIPCSAEGRAPLNFARGAFAGMYVDSVFAFFAAIDPILIRHAMPVGESATRPHDASGG